MAATTDKASSKAPTRKEPPSAEMTLKGHEEEVYGVAFIPGTHLLVTCSDDKTLRVWDLDTGKQVGEPLLGYDAEVRRVAASPDGRWIVSGGTNGSILVWEVATNGGELKKVPVSFKGHGRNVLSVVFAPDSETFASASWDQTVCVWKRETGKIVLGPLKVGSEAFSVSYSPDGKKLAAGTNKHIIVWNAETGKELLKIEQRAYRLAFTPDGLRLVSGSEKVIRISDAISIAPNGTKFGTTSQDKTTRFFDLTTFEPIGEPLEHPEAVSSVAFSEDSQLIATGCYDKLVRTWTVPLSASEKESLSTQKILKKTIRGPNPLPKRAPIPTSRFFDGFDTRSPPGCNNRTGTTRHDEGSRIKNTINRLFSRSSAPQGHAPRPRRIPLVDVFATRGKYRTANAHSGKRHLAKPPRPPRQQAHASHAGASSSSVAPAGTSNVNDGAIPATVQAGGTGVATQRPPSPLDLDRVPGTSCFAFLARCFPRFSRTQRTSPATPHTR